jgi:tetratricopeptide (TPR) repeat protein
MAGVENRFGGIARNVVQAGHIDELHVHTPAPAPTGLGGLPADEGFIGRADELAALAAALAPDDDPDAPTACVVAGLGGVGKTALAVRAARQAESDGWFPGGVLFIDLQGYDEGRRVDAVSALSTLLRELGVVGEYIPQGQAELEALYRSVLATFADEGRHVLVLLDNAATLDQVLPLRPGRREHRMVVTTRHTLPVPGARRLELEVLPDADGIAVLDRALRAANPDDARVGAEPDAAAALVDLCGGLPLALRIIAEVLADEPDQSIAELVDVLASEHDRLSELAYGDAIGVRVVFNTSYRHLPDEQARLFRLLSINPGPYVDLETAAAIVALPATTTRRLLNELRRAHLVQRVSDFYFMHDLVLLYAIECVEQFDSDEDRTDAIERLVSHYLHVLRAAIAQVDSLVVAAPGFPDRAHALAWLDSQLPNLMAVAEFAGDEGHTATMGHIGLLLHPYFDLHADNVSWAAVAELALTAARLLGDATMEADALNSLGSAYQGLRDRFDDAIECLHQALASYEYLNNRDGMAAVLTNLGNADRSEDRLDDACEKYQRALTLYRETGSRYGETLALINLGIAREKQGRYQNALELYQEALAGFVVCNDQHHEASALTVITRVLLKLEQSEQAAEHFERAIALYRELGDRHGEAWSISTVADGYLELEQFGKVIDVRQQALAIWRELDSTYQESEVMTQLAWAYWQAGRLAEASEHDLMAIARHQETGNLYGEATILAYLGLVYAVLGEMDNAMDCYQRSVAIYEQIEAHDEAETARQNMANLDRVKAPGGA